MLFKHGGLIEVMNMRFRPHATRTPSADDWRAPWNAGSSERSRSDWLAVRAWEDDGGAELSRRGFETRRTVGKERT
jgi:hypothetical protein